MLVLSQLISKSWWWLCHVVGIFWLLTELGLLYLFNLEVTVDKLKQQIEF